jgi:CRISPR-associated protein (TIGR02584 family)
MHMTAAERREVLLATFGATPQIVTIGLDLLLHKQHPITHVHLIRTDHPYVREAAAKLEEEWDEGLRLYKRGWLSGNGGPVDCPLEQTRIKRDDGQLAWDVVDDQDVKATFNTIYSALDGYKERGDLVHLLLAGGRKGMSAYATVAAQILFEFRDRMWHVLSSEEFENSKAMHPGSREDAHLVPIPVLRLGAFVPRIAKLVGETLRGDPYEATAALREVLDVEEKERFIEGLSDKERRVLELLATQGAKNEEIAASLHVTSGYVEKLIQAIWNKLPPTLTEQILRPEVEKGNRTMLAIAFAPCYQLRRS